MLVLAGEKVSGVELASGKSLWGPVKLGALFPSGRGFVGERYAYVPAAT